MNPEELEFILKMRDEASALLDKMGDALKRTGDGAKKFGDEGEKAGNKLDKIVKKAKEAAAAVGGLYTSMRTFQGVTNAWSQYELGLVGVVKTTNMAGRELDDFRKKFDNLNRGLNGIETGQLQQLSETVGQLGVKGVNNIISMTEVLGKLGVTTDIVGAQGASAVSRILTLTGEGAKAVGEFGDALNYLGNNTAATESEILDMATVLAQSTAEFGLSSKNILALSAGARQLGVNFELFGTSSGRVLRSLRDGLANNTTGFKSFLQVTNMTKEEFASLLAEKPEEVLLKFAEAYNSLTASGGSKGLLQSLGMDTDEIKRVFGAIGTQVDAVRDKLRLVQSPDMNGALDREAQQFFDAQANEIQGMTKAWTGLKAVIGEAMAPLTGPLIAAATGTLNTLSDVIQSLPVGIKQLAASFIVLAPAVGGAIAAFRILSPLLATMGFSGAVSGVGLLTKALGGFRAAISLAGTALARVWPLIVGMLVAEGVRRSDDWITAWVKRNFSEENLQRMRDFRKEYQGFFDFMAQDPLTGTIQSGPNAGMNYWSGKRDYTQNDKGEWVEYKPEPPKDWGDGIGQTLHQQGRRCHYPDQRRRL
jgi:TP901 family phage tail tape measure protein